MCKNVEIQNTVIEQAKEDADEVFAIYEQGDDLVGLVKVYKRLAILYDVHRDGTLDYFSKGRVYRQTTVRYIRNLFGFSHDALVWSMFKVVPC